MGSKSNVLELATLDAVLGPGYTPPATVYWALYSATPTDAGGGTELTSGAAPGYARLAATNNTTNFPAAATNGTTGLGEKKVGVDQTLAANSSGVNWPTVVAFGLFDASTGGNLLLWGAVAPLAITPAASFVIPANSVFWTEE